MNNLKNIMEKRGMSISSLSEQCGLCVNRIWQLQKTSANPTLKTAYIICKVLCVEVTDIWPNTVEVVEETITVRRVKIK